MSIALEILRSVGIPQYQVKFLKTDAIFVQSSQRMAKKAKEALCAVTFANLHDKRVPNSTHWNGESLVDTSGNGEGKVFRVAFSNDSLDKAEFLQQKLRNLPELCKKTTSVS